MTLALIAGRGDLPALVAAACDVPPLVCGYEGVALNGIKADLTFRLETLGTLLLELGTQGVTQACFAGGLERPTLDLGKLDAETAPLVTLFTKALEKGDDGALRVIVDLFEKTGFAVRAAQDLVPDLLAKAGVYGELWPDAQMRKGASVAAAHILATSAQDIGQACVVKNGRVIAVEGRDGTDAMLARLPPLTGGLLFKGPKAGQSRKIDLPTVGPETLRAVQGAGLRALVVDVGDVLVLHPDQCAALADDLKIVFWARTGQ